MAATYLDRLKIDDKEYEIHATKAASADVAQKTQGKLKIGEIQFDGSQDAEIPVYKGDVNK